MEGKSRTDHFKLLEILKNIFVKMAVLFKESKSSGNDNFSQEEQKLHSINEHLSSTTLLQDKLQDMISKEEGKNSKSKLKKLFLTECNLTLDEVKKTILGNSNDYFKDADDAFERILVKEEALKYSQLYKDCQYDFIVKDKDFFNNVIQESLNEINNFSKESNLPDLKSIAPLFGYAKSKTRELALSIPLSPLVNERELNPELAEKLEKRKERIKAFEQSLEKENNQESKPTFGVRI